VEGQPGSLRLLLLAGAQSGTVVLESFWASRGWLHASGQTATALRGELAQRAQAVVTAETYRVTVFEEDTPLRGGQRARLTRIQVRPPAVADVIETFGDTAVPGLAETPGFCGALLFADPASGHLISQTLWRDPQARAASPSTAAMIQADVLQSAHCVIGAIEDYTLVLSTARKD
jgi:hypothetical protein